MEHLPPRDSAWIPGLEEDDSENGDNHFLVGLALISLLIFISCLALNPAQRCLRQRTEDRERRFRDSLRPPPSLQSQQNRRDFISNVLVTKHALAESSKHERAAVSKFHDIIIPRLSSSLHTVMDDERVQLCSICLSEYKDGDDICWSHNASCNHVFHRSCITEWLVRHDECPICRQDFLSMEGLDDEVQETEHAVMPQPTRAVQTSGEIRQLLPEFWIGSMFQRSRPFGPRLAAVHPTQQTSEHDLELSEVESGDASSTAAARQEALRGDSSIANETDEAEVSIADEMEDVELGNSDISIEVTD